VAFSLSGPGAAASIDPGPSARRALSTAESRRAPGGAAALSASYSPSRNGTSFATNSFVG